MDNQASSRPFTILLADDGSQHAQAAAEMICDLPLGQGSQVIVLGVLAPRDASGHARMSEILQQRCACFEEKGVSAGTALLVGYPAQVIVEYAGEVEPDLIVAGARGLRATLGILLGGVAQQVVEYADWPVLVVRGPYRGLKRVLVLTDGSRYSQYMLDYLSGRAVNQTTVADEEQWREKVYPSGSYLRVSQRYEGANQIKEGMPGRRFPLAPDIEVHVVHVLPPLFESAVLEQMWLTGGEYTGAYVPLALEEVEKDNSAAVEREEREGRALLETALTHLREGGIQAIGTLLRGDAATEVMQYIEDNHIDLAICGSRGLGQMQGWLLGSFSRKMVHYADCSVLVVKGPLPKE